MRIALCYPPDATVPTAPFGSIPLLQACLKRAGNQVVPLDLAAITFHWVIRHEILAQFYAYAAAQTDPDVRAGFARLLAIPEEMVFGAEQAARDLRDPKTYFDPLHMRAAWQRIHAVVELLSLIRPRFDPRNKTFTRELFAHLEEDVPDKWVESYELLLLEQMKQFGPELVAITVPFSTQIAPAMKLARWMHRRFPGCKVVAGGTGLSDAENVLLKDARFYDYIDYVCVGDGEEALPELAAALEGKGDIANVPGLFRRIEGAVVPPGNRRVASMDASPTPDFSGLPFDLYLAPEKIAILATSRGCYYGKCTFCPESFRLRYRRRSSPSVWADVKNIAVEQGISNFMFWDPLTPPGMLTEISERSKEEGVEINWTAEVKFEHIYSDPEYVRTLSEGGCRYLQFGFESGVQHVLDAMDKGNDLQEIDTILDRLAEVNIHTGVFFFVGFPTELEDEARETWRYLVRNRDRITFAGYIGTFGMGHDVPVFKNPDRFGIEVVYTPAGDPTYRRKDGLDWEHEYLNQTYRVRNDLYLIESCTALLYVRRKPDLVMQLSPRMHMGPPVFIRPALERERLTIPASNGFHTEKNRKTGESRSYGFVARSSTIHELAAEDMAVVELVRRGGHGADVLALPDPAVRERLTRLIDFGVLETPAMGPDDTVVGEAQRRASAALAS